jgi:hypothetical protein
MKNEWTAASRALRLQMAPRAGGRARAVPNAVPGYEWVQGRSTTNFTGGAAAWAQRHFVATAARTMPSSWPVKGSLRLDALLFGYTAVTLTQVWTGCGSCPQTEAVQWT